MKPAHLLLALIVFILVGCMQNRQKMNCSILVQDVPQLELKVDTLFDIKKYQIRANIQQICPIESVLWTFLLNEEEYKSIHSTEDKYVDIPHRVISRNNSNIRVEVTYSDGEKRRWQFPLEDVISGE